MTDTLILKATVDQEWGTSNITSDVRPSDKVNDPQSHFVRLRMDANYAKEHKEKHVKY